MSNYTFELDPDTIGDLAALWVNSPGPAAVTRADATAARLLGADPFENGVPVSEGLWKLAVPPLVFYYAIYPNARLVKVGAVRELRP